MVSSLTEEMPALRVEHSNLPADLDEMNVLMQRMKCDVGKSLSSVTPMVQITYDNMVSVDKQNIQ